MALQLMPLPDLKVVEVMGGSDFQGASPEPRSAAMSAARLQIFVPFLVNVKL